MKKLLSILLVLAMVISLGATAFAEEEKKDDPDLETYLNELAEKGEVTEEDLTNLLCWAMPSPESSAGIPRSRQRT